MKKKTIKTDEWQWPKYWKEIIRNILPLACPPLPPSPVQEWQFNYFNFVMLKNGPS